MTWNEEAVHEIHRRRKLAVARWTVHGQWAIAVFKPGREDQCGKIGWKRACPVTLALRIRALELQHPLRRKFEPKKRMGN